MKKLLFILAIIFMAGTTFAKTGVSSKRVTPAIKTLSSSTKLNNAQKVSSGYITDSNGNRVGWWAYDDQSGVLITYLYPAAQ